MAARRVIRELLVRLGVVADTKKVADFRKEVDGSAQSMKDAEAAAQKAEQASKRFASELGGGARTSLQEGAKLALGLAAGLSAVAVGLVKAAVDTGAYGDRVAKTAQQVQIGVEAYQELEYAARRTGGDQQALRDGLKTVARTAYEAAKGTGEAAELYRSLGVDPKTEGRMKSADRLLEEFADKLAGLNDGSDVALVQRIFGEGGGLKLLPLLKGGTKGIQDLRREARELGFVLDAESARAAEEFQDELLNAQLAMEGVRNEIGAELLPHLTELLEGFVAGVKHIRPLVKAFFSLVDRTIGWKVALVGLFGTIAALLGTAGLLGLAAALGAAVTGLAAFASAVGVAMIPAALLMAAILVQLVVTFGILAAIVGTVVLVVDDLVGFFNGADSVIGRLLERIKTSFPLLGAWIDVLRELAGIAYELGRIFLEWAIAELRKPIDDAVAAVTELYNAMVKFLDLDVVGRVSKWLGPLGTAFDILRDVGSDLGGVRTQLAGVSGAEIYEAGRSAFAGALFAPTQPPGSTSNSVTNNATTVNAPITLNTTGNADTAMAVQQGVGGGVRAGMAGNRRAGQGR